MPHWLQPVFIQCEVDRLALEPSARPALMGETRVGGAGPPRALGSPAERHNSGGQRVGDPWALLSHFSRPTPGLP